jgi:hypothetical protein
MAIEGRRKKEEVRVKGEELVQGPRGEGRDGSLLCSLLSRVY